MRDNNVRLPVAVKVDPLCPSSKCLDMGQRRKRTKAFPSARGAVVFEEASHSSGKQCKLGISIAVDVAERICTGTGYWPLQHCNLCPKAPVALVRLIEPGAFALREDARQPIA